MLGDDCKIQDFIVYDIDVKWLVFEPNDIFTISSKKYYSVIDKLEKDSQYIHVFFMYKITLYI